MPYWLRMSLEIIEISGDVMNQDQSSRFDGLLKLLYRYSGPPLRLMEVCGTHTHAFFASGLRDLLATVGIELLSGPGCPVCVTAQADVDLSQELALRPGVRLATFGDMLRVPGSRRSLAEVRALGAKVTVVYSPMDAVELAEQHPAEFVVFIGIGFETTAPTAAVAITEASKRGLANFSIYPLHKVIPPALQLIARDDRLRIDGFICPGHVSVITGTGIYEPIARASGKPCVITGFEPEELALGVLELVHRIETWTAGVSNTYPRAVSDEGNLAARRLLDEVFTPAPAVWRGLGKIPDSGLELREMFSRFDCRERLEAWPDYTLAAEQPDCHCGEVLLGLLRPGDCPRFGSGCSPLTPVGPCMVSREGACQTYYTHYARGRA
jgi:hydrogenase expression/formation protein HypD